MDIMMHPLEAKVQGLLLHSAWACTCTFSIRSLSF